MEELYEEELYEEEVTEVEGEVAEAEVEVLEEEGSEIFDETLEDIVDNADAEVEEPEPVSDNRQEGMPPNWYEFFGK